MAGGITCISLAIAFILIFNLRPYGYHPNKIGSNIIINLFLIPVLVAPIIEEIRYRGFLSSKKSINILFLILTPLNLFLGEFSWYSLSIYLGLYIAYFSYRRSKLNKTLYLLVFLSAIHFAINHLPKDINMSWEYLPFILIPFGMAQILSWIVINYSLRKAILVHAFWNLILGLIHLSSLQFVSSDHNIFENEVHRFEWNRVPYFESHNRSFKDSAGIYIGKAVDLGEVLFIMKADSFVVTEPSMRYDFEYQNYKNENFWKSSFLDLLQKEGLIVERKTF
ncbi:CPBP family glutamic-type intramembrane protease [Belliella sp. DSM 107340]|uniref:CPBP family glutamic-type intramembrane protease n=1 Tax=Belliella calami TaxID=2923436 RepID=A0ABS9UL36_9BACT|nr:CPBP family glutamic-type intramembrane protease [Belliella calami]MCH7397339.1 CPBP family glutamic-type intramembrane protease [Belliella calami]